MADADAAKLADAVRSIYDQAAVDLIGVIAQQASATLERIGETDMPSLRDEALAAARVAQVASRIRARLDTLGITATQDALTKAQASGLRKAERELAALLGGQANDFARPGRAGALATFARALVTNQRAAHASILRRSADAYRDVIAEAVNPKISGANAKRLTVAQKAMDRLAERGVVDFVDRSGRRWELATYVEMATRTAIARTMVEAQVERLATQGLDLVVVSDSPRECHLCRPWEGKVLARTGGPRTEQRKSRIGPQMVDVEIAGSLALAMAAGFLHPNCTHAVAAYLPGATRLKTATENPKGYAERQELRALERGVRRAKRLQAAALDKAAKRDATAEVKVWNAAIAEHVKKTGLIRQKERERVGEGLAR